MSYESDQRALRKKYAEEKKAREAAEAKALSDRIAKMRTAAAAAYPGWAVKPSEYGYGYAFSVGPLRVEPRPTKHGSTAATLGELVKVDLERNEWRTRLKSKHVVCKWSSFLKEAASWRALQDELEVKETQLKERSRAGTALCAQVEQLLKTEKLEGPLRAYTQVRSDEAQVIFSGVHARHLPEGVALKKLPTTFDLRELHEAVLGLQQAIEQFTTRVHAVAKRMEEGSAS